jgi:epsilon-lactone hydrolase
MLTDASSELRSAAPSLLMRLGVWLVKRGPDIFPRDPAKVEAFLHQRKPPVGPPLPPRLERRFTVERRALAGQRCITLHPKAGRGAKHILYFHGGGFVLPNVKQHWDLLAARVETTGASVTAALYDLVPEHPAANADRLADAAFAALCETWDARDIALAGDSAGGHMALSLALRLGAAGGSMPGHLVLFAPWLDLTMQDEAMRAVEPHDFMLTIEPLRLLGKVWAEGRDPASPQCSPLYATTQQLAALPPTRIFTGRHDLFIIDSRSFTGRLRAAGVDAKLYEYEAAPHVFMALAATREAKDVFGLVRDFLTRQSTL